MIKDFFPIMFINKKANLGSEPKFTRADGFPPNNLVEKIQLFDILTNHSLSTI